MELSVRIIYKYTNCAVPIPKHRLDQIRLLGFTTLHDSRRYTIPRCMGPSHPDTSHLIFIRDERCDDVKHEQKMRGVFQMRQSPRRIMPPTKHKLPQTLSRSRASAHLYPPHTRALMGSSTSAYS